MVELWLGWGFDKTLRNKPGSNLIKHKKKESTPASKKQTSTRNNQIRQIYIFIHYNSMTSTPSTSSSGTKSMLGWVDDLFN